MQLPASKNIFMSKPALPIHNTGWLDPLMFAVHFIPMGPRLLDVACAMGGRDS
jgi:hypothetical protein